MLLRKPALLYHAFYSAAPGHALTQDSPARQVLERTWQRVGDLGFDRRIQDVWPTELPPPGATAAPSGLRFLAARGTSDGTGWNQAFAYLLGDTVGVSVLRELTGPTADWTSLAEPWESPDGSQPHLTDGVFGGAVVVLGLVTAEDWDRLEASSVPGATALGADLADELGLSAEDGGWSDSWLRPAQDFLVWELPAAPGAAGARRVLAVAREDREVALLHWLWSAPRPGLPVFTSYLRHAAQLRHQYRILAGDLGRIRDSLHEVDAGCRELVELLRGDRIPVDRLLAAENTLGLLQLREGGLIAQVADLRVMTHTVKTARRNLTAVLGPLAPGASGGPLRHDSQLARWTLEQLDAEQVFLSATLTKATEIGRISSAAVGGRLAERRENLLLFQTSLLGALLMVLAAIQSFAYTVRIPGPLFAPAIALLGALALFLPPAVLHWRRHAPRPDRWTRLDLLFAGCVGAPLGWLAATALHLLAARTAAPPSLSVMAALVGILLAMFLFHSLRDVAERRRGET